MFSSLFKNIDKVSRYIDSLTRLFSEKEEEVYRNNIKVATTYNEHLLEKSYDELIYSRFEEGNRSDRSLNDYQADFQALLDCYGADSVRVATQLRTFNDFIMERKLEYAENL